MIFSLLELNLSQFFQIFRNDRTIFMCFMVHSPFQFFYGCILMIQKIAAWHIGDLME